ncbi:MAG: hypothetical protein QOE23_2166, partial [Pseudonocardiales bacterium]|nr:hypothetical protein [Pseudonocardiales bacterium]
MQGTGTVMPSTTWVQTVPVGVGSGTGLLTVGSAAGGWLLDGAGWVAELVGAGRLLLAGPPPDGPPPDCPVPDDLEPEDPAPDEPAPDEPAPEDPEPEDPAPDEPAPDEPEPDAPEPRDPVL